MAYFANLFGFFRCLVPFFLFGTPHANPKARPVRRRLKTRMRKFRNMITKLDKTDWQRLAVSMVGALTLTAASVIAAAGPVKAAPAAIQNIQLTAR